MILDVNGECGIFALSTVTAVSAIVRNNAVDYEPASLQE